MGHTGSDILTNELLEHGEWLRLLAHRLVQHDDDVDDAVQETWLAALRSPPRHKGRLQSWLGSLMRNGLRQEHRSSRRRRRREEEIFEERSGRSAADTVETSEIGKRVARILVEIEEPHGSTLRQLYFDGLSTRRIADLEGVSEVTIRSRHRRALERLRERLDSSFGGRRRDWSLALLPIALGSMRSSRHAITMGIMTTLSSKLAAVLIAAAVLIVTLVGLIGFGGSDGFGSLGEGNIGADPDRQEARRETGNTTGNSAKSPDAPVIDASEAHRSSTATTEESGSVETMAPATAKLTAPDAAPHLLWGRLEGLDPGVPWNSTLRLQALWSGKAPKAGAGEILIEIPVDGRFSVDWSRFAVLEPPPDLLELLAADPFYVASNHRFDPHRKGRREDRPVIFRVESAAALTGIVVDESGTPIPGAGVAAYGVREGRPRDHAEGRTVSDEAGRFRLKAGQAGTAVVIAALSEDAADERGAGAYLLPSRAEVDLVPGRLLQMEPLVLREGKAISGQVLWGDRRPAAGLGIKIDVAAEDGLSTFFTDDFDLFQDDAGAIGRRDMRATSDENGHFRFAGLTARPYRLMIECITEDLIAVTTRSELIVAAPAEDLEVILEGSRLDLTVTGDGATLSRAQVTVKEGGHLWSTTSREGRLAVLIEPGRIYEIRAQARGFAEKTIVFDPKKRSTPFTETIDLEPEIERRLIVELRDPEGQPLTRARIAMMHREGEPGAFDWKERRNEDGNYVIEGLKPGKLRLAFDPPRNSRRPDDRYWLRTEARVLIPQSGDLRERVTLKRGGRFRLRLRDRAGVTLGGFCKLRGPGGSRPRLRFFVGGEGGWTEGGPDQILDVGFNQPSSALPSGSWTFEIGSEGHRSVTRHITLKAGETVEFDLVLDKS